VSTTGGVELKDAADKMNKGDVDDFDRTDFSATDRDDMEDTFDMSQSAGTQISYLTMSEEEKAGNKFNIAPKMFAGSLSMTKTE
jgi:hypothetical protein